MLANLGLSCLNTCNPEAWLKLPHMAEEFKDDVLLAKSFVQGSEY